MQYGVKNQKQVDKQKKLVYDAVDAFPDNKKRHPQPTSCLPTTMGIRRKGIRVTLPTYECQSEAYYSLLEYLCQVLIPFRPQIAYRYPDLAYFFVFVSVHKY